MKKGNGRKEGKRETGNGKRETGNGKRETRKGTYVPPAGRKVGLVGRQLDGGHLDDDLQPGLAEAVAEALALATRVRHRLEAERLVEDRVADLAPLVHQPRPGERRAAVVPVGVPSGFPPPVPVAHVDLAVLALVGGEDVSVECFVDVIFVGVTTTTPPKKERLIWG